MRAIIVGFAIFVMMLSFGQAFSMDNSVSYVLDTDTGNCLSISTDKTDELESISTVECTESILNEIKESNSVKYGD